MNKQSAETSVYDFCIVGLGIGGLNALFVATQYLPKGSSILLIDKHPRVGGMWNESYDHVRLHQPHQMFTVGDLEWEWDRPPEYLATGVEVQAHLESCLRRLERDYSVTKLFEHSYESADEIGDLVKITAKDQSSNQTISLKAKKAILTLGWGIPQIKAKAVTSEHVISTSPVEFVKDDTDPSTPVYIIGGGKTGTDTAQFILQKYPDRKVTLIDGVGNRFGDRDMLFPTGLGRFWRGKLVGKISADIIMRLDGKNFESVFDYFRSNYTVGLRDDGEQYFFSILSRAEAQFLNKNLNQIIPNYFDDVIDVHGSPVVSFRDGDKLPIKHGAIILNSTGHLLRGDTSYQSFVSKGGRIARVNPRSSIYFLSTTSSYFLAHLLMQDKLRRLPLYEVDLTALFKRDRKTFFLVSLTQSFLNMLTMMENVDMEVFGKCGVDLNRWYPMSRRLLSFASLKMNQKRYMAHCREVLSIVEQELGIECRPLIESKKFQGLAEPLDAA